MEAEAAETMEAEAAETLAAAARPFIDLIDTLRAHGVNQDLPLPQIAVMGDQSSGKSSVLELISGVPFPRGTGLVTRCATQLIMKRTPPGSPWTATASVSWQGPQPNGAGPVRDQKSLCAAIQQLTQALCSTATNSFSRESIVINLTSPEVPDLTLLDLPGIVRTTVAGQSASVVEDVNALIESYLSQERTIILAVIPANQDIATIDILERASRVDPTGERTLAVLTKPDLVDAGAEEEVKAVLANKRKPLRLGYAMVKCRSQKELDSQSTLSEAQRVEAEFFKNHPHWSMEDSKKLGVGALTKRLSTLLVDRIKVSLPSIKYELQLQRESASSEFERLGGHTAAVDANAMRAEIVRVVAEYTTLLRQSARGNYGNAMLARRSELRLFGETQTIFRGLKAEVVATQPRFEEASFIERLTAEMSAFRGRELPGFTNSQVFYGFMVQNIEQWRPWVEHCRQQYIAAARSVSDSLAQALAPNYPALAVEIRTRAHQVMDKFGDEVQEKLDEVFAKESDPYTTNESMLELINQIRLKNFDIALQSVLSTAPPGSIMSSNEKARNVAKAHVKRQLGRWYMQTHGVNTTSKVEDMCTLLQAYWDVATKRLVDNVCMTLEHDFTAAILKELESECFLFAAEYAAPDREVELRRLFREDPAVVELRRAAKAKEERLSAALESLKSAAPDVVAARPNGARAPKALAPGFFQQSETNLNVATADSGTNIGAVRQQKTDSFASRKPPSMSASIASQPQSRAPPPLPDKPRLPQQGISEQSSSYGVMPRSFSSSARPSGDSNPSYSSLYGGRDTMAHREPVFTTASPTGLSAAQSAVTLASSSQVQAMVSSREAQALATSREAQALASSREAQALASSREAQALAFSREAQALASSREAQALASSPQFQEAATSVGTAMAPAAIAAAPSLLSAAGSAPSRSQGLFGSSLFGDDVRTLKSLDAVQHAVLTFLRRLSTHNLLGCATPTNTGTSCCHFDVIQHVIGFVADSSTVRSLRPPKLTRRVFSTDLKYLSCGLFVKGNHTL